MAEEPQPDTIVEGVTEESTLPTNAEDRKAAAALSALDARGDDDEETSGKKDVDTAALDKAMKNLDVKASKADVYKGKIDAADVNLVVSTVGMELAGMDLIFTIGLGVGVDESEGDGIAEGP